MPIIPYIIIPLPAVLHPKRKHIVVDATPT